MENRKWVYTPNSTTLRFVYDSDSRILDVFERESGRPSMSVFNALFTDDEDFRHYCDEIASGRIPHRDS